MTEDADSTQGVFTLKSAIILFFVLGALLGFVLPGMGRAMTQIYNMMISFFVTLFHELFPGMDWF